VDPIAGGLRMDRFLSRDRTRPPDVDLDVEHERRDEVIAELSERFSVRQVGSHMQYSLWEEDEGDVGKGSLMVRYHTSARKSGVTDKLPWRDIPKADKDMLVALGNMKLISGPGTHAAGYIVAPDEAAVSELPLNWIASRKAFVTAYAKKDVEALGFVKVDLLGLRTLTAIRVTCTEIARQMSAETGEEPDPQGLYESIPINDRATLQKIGSGNNIGVFQLEGFAMSKGCERLKPKKMDDIIAAQALFRPATMGSGATSDYIGRRNKTEQVPSRHIDIQQETAETYGVLLYQEQVIGVLRRMGMPADELTNMLDAVKASNEASAAAAVALEQAKPRIRQLAGDRGWAEPDIDWLISALVAYGEYSFNKAHAASYGLVAYRTAYLATHYPTEFWLGMVTAFSNHPKENDYVRAARSQKVQVLPAHVNKSGVTYSIDGKVIRKGLLSVKGVGKISAEELVANQPYRDLRDLGERVTPRKVSGAKGLALGKDPDECGGVISHLAESGALHGLEREVQLELS
jgi:DNA polymerase-3 subunit alpha